MNLLLATLSAMAAHHPGIRYAPGPAGLLDLDTPADGGPFAVVVAVHGGGWTGGSRAGAQPFCRTVLEMGLACAAIDYRLAPGARLPAQLEDVRKSAKFLIANARRYGLDSKGVIFAGESAGAHLVSYIGATHDDGIPLLGVIAFSPPTDLLKLSEPGRALSVIPPGIRDLLDLRDWDAASEQSMREASPSLAVRSGAPPFLIFQGQADAIVPPSQAVVLCEALKAKGASCELRMLAGARHGLWSEEQYDTWIADWKPQLTRWLGEEIKQSTLGNRRVSR